MSDSIRVATYNCRLAATPGELTDFNANPRRTWQDRVENVANEIMKALPDVICLPETSTVRYAADADYIIATQQGIPFKGATTQILDLVDKLCGYSILGKENHGMHVLIRTKLIELTDYTSYTFQQKASNGNPQGWLKATLKQRQTGKQFTLGATHLVYNGADGGDGANASTSEKSYRYLQAKEIKEVLKNVSGTKVVLGDWNNPSTSSASPYGLMTVGLGLKDCSNPASFPTGKIYRVNADLNTYNGWNTPTADKINLLDRIFVSQNVTVLTSVNLIPSNIKTTSDHDLVYADIVL